ncbi:MAG: DoxX family protein [Chlamydiales bacterium]|nr:DoxX family protein [Chlamydiales bacterium]
MIYVNPKLNFFAKFYNFFLKIGSNLQSIFLFFMRVTWGHQFFLAGVAKLQNIDHAKEFFSAMGIFWPEMSAYLVSYFEIIGGICLMIGFASRIITIPLIIIILTALGTAHSYLLKNVIFILDPHSFAQDLPFPYFITAMLVFCFGPGRLSLDAWIKRWVEKQPRY